MVAEPAPLTYRPQPVQEPWHACPAFESGYGGAKGGGKTLAMLMESVRGVAHPRYRAIIFRRTYPRLQEVMDRAWDWFPGLGARWDGNGHRWVFPSGAMISMRHCQNEEDKRNYHGHEYHFMGFDQLEEFSESQYTFLLAQCRSSIREIKPYVRATFNPGGIGHAWVKARFVERGTRACAPWVPTNDAGDPLPPRCFHFATVYDNPALLEADPQYLRVLDALPEQERRALKGGDWDVFAGQVFTEWRREKHVIAPFLLDKEWPRLRCTDYGSARPFVTLWLAIDPSVPRIYVYREISQPGLLASEQAKKVVELSDGDPPVKLHAADPAMWIKNPESGKSIADLYYENGVTLSPANNDRINGLARVREYLKDAPDGRPHLQVFSICTQLVKNLPALVYDAHKVEDVDTDGPDDEYDCLVAGTMVTTDRGELPIERIRGGMRVLTRGGYRRVAGAWLSHQSAPVLRVELSDGRAITGTPNHRIPRDDEAYTTIGELRYGDIMHVVDEYVEGATCASESRKSSSSMGSGTTATRMRSSGRIACTSRPARSTVRRDSRRFIGTSGLLTTAVRSLQGMTSITPMRTPSTTTPATSWLARGERIRPSTGSQTPQRAIAASGAGQTLRVERSTACTSAATAVSRRGVEPRVLMMRSVAVPSAVLRSASTDLRIRSAAPVSVVSVSDAGRAPVFNLQVDGVHEYFANGVLVSNSLRYGLMACMAIPDFGAMRSVLPLGFQTGDGQGRPSEPVALPDKGSRFGRLSAAQRLALLTGEYQSTSAR